MWASSLLFAGAFAALFAASAARADDNTPPVISYTAPAAGTTPKGALTIAANITDESRFFPQIFFRHGAAGPFEKPIDMKKRAGTANTYEGTIPYKTDLVEYYIEAYDDYGNGPARAGDPDKPFKIALGEIQAVVPPPPMVAANKPPPPAPANNPGANGKSTTAPAPTSGATASRSNGRTWTWIVGGVGLGLLAGGLVAGLAVKTEDDAYKQALAGTPNGNGTTQINDPASLAAQHDANQKLGTKATILTISGGVLLAGGVALFFIEGMGNSSSSDSHNGNSSSPNYNNPPPSNKKATPNPEQNGPGFNGSNDLAPAALPAVSSLSFGAAPVQGGAAVAVAGHF